MSHPSTHPTTTTEAPWKSLFQSHLSSHPSGEFSLATVTHTGLPKTRTCIHRGFFASPLPENKHNEHPPNPHVFDTDCPTFTTDARMSKVYDIFATGKGKGTPEQSRSGTGGGGYVEACYWVKDAGMQWRILGKCWILADEDIEGHEDPDAQNSGTVTAKAELGRYMRPAGGKGDGGKSEKDWSWRREVEMHFANLSPMMRGSFKNPPPGQPQDNGAGQGEKLGQKAGDLEEEPLARKNFRVAVIAPEEVEVVDLNDPANSSRTKWTLSAEAGGAGGGGSGKPLGEWNEVKLWP